MFGTFLFITTTAKSNSNSSGDVFHTTAPDALIELGVDTDIFGTHHGKSGSLDALNGEWSALFEGAAVDVLMHVDGGFTSKDFGGGTFGFLFVSHLRGG